MTEYGLRRLGLAFALLVACEAQRKGGSQQAPVTEAGVPRGIAAAGSAQSDRLGDTTGPSRKRKSTSEPNAMLTYNLSTPDQKWVLPTLLREVSDIAVLSATEVACVQDERGTVYIYDLGRQRIQDESRFAPKGDYEGLAIADSSPFVLRSDGKLFWLSNFGKHPQVRTYDLQLPARESEALCYDPINKRLLIAPKTESGDAESKDERIIYQFALPPKQQRAEPALQVSLQDIRRFAKDHGLPLPRRAKKSGQGMHTVLHFRPSAMAVHPQTGELYVLSSSDHVLVSFALSGVVTGYELLDAELFRQPEGLAFFPNGDLLISNEAAGKEPTMLLFRQHRGAP